MRDPDDLQHELDAAQADLQQHVGELKNLVEAKLEAPRRLVAAARKPIAWLDAHPLLACLGALAVGALVGLRRATR